MVAVALTGEMLARPPSAGIRHSTAGLAGALATGLRRAAVLAPAPPSPSRRAGGAGARRRGRPRPRGVRPPVGTPGVPRARPGPSRADAGHVTGAGSRTALTRRVPAVRTTRSEERCHVYVQGRCRIGRSRSGRVGPPAGRRPGAEADDAPREEHEPRCVRRDDRGHRSSPGGRCGPTETGTRSRLRRSRAGHGAEEGAGVREPAPGGTGARRRPRWVPADVGGVRRPARAAARPAALRVIARGDRGAVSPRSRVFHGRGGPRPSTGEGRARPAGPCRAH